MAVHLWKTVARVWVDLVEAEVMFEGILHPQCELTHHLEMVYTHFHLTLVHHSISCETIYLHLYGVVIPEKQTNKASLLIIPITE